MIRKYFEQGYNPLPIAHMGKNPVIKEWSRWCTEKPSDELIDTWNEQYKKQKLNIGIACGASSGIVVVDIDTDDPAILDLCPRSTVSRRGKKGEARFFRYDSSVKSKPYPLIDILSDGRQIVIPPSIHPDTKKPYIWLTDSLLDFKPSDLPILDTSFLEKLGPKFKEIGSVKEGRNNRLKSIVAAMRGRGEGEVKIVDEVYEWDKKFHPTRLFTDPTSNFKATNENDAKRNAWKFVANVTASLIQFGVAQVNEELVIELTDEEVETAKMKAFEFKPYPRARGLMGKFQDLCDLKSAGNQDATGLGGALALMSVLSANKFVTECRGLVTTPNLYIINLGYSSFGKEMAQSLINDLLAETGLLGLGSYRSDVAVIAHLPKQQERIDVIDECSSLLAGMGKKDGHLSGAVELLSELYSKASTKYHGQASIINGPNFGACWNPHITLLGSTTPKGFRSSVNREIAAKGFLPRILQFFQNDIKEYKGRKDRSKVQSMFDDLKKQVDKFIAIKKVRHPLFNPEIEIQFETKPARKGGEKETVALFPQGERYIQTINQMSSDAEEMWLQYEEQCHINKCRDPEGFESAFIGRFAENVAKIAHLDALSLGRKTIETDSVLWAVEVVETQWHNSAPLYEIAHAENRNEANLLKILSIIKKAGIINRKDLNRSNRGRILSKELDEIIKTLDESGQISIIKNSLDSKNCRPTTYYKAL